MDVTTYFKVYNLTSMRQGVFSPLVLLISYQDSRFFLKMKIRCPDIFLENIGRAISFCALFSRTDCLLFLVNAGRHQFTQQPLKPPKRNESQKIPNSFWEKNQPSQDFSQVL